MEVELYNYLNERDIKNYAAERKHIEEKKLSKENYVKIIAYQTLIGMDRYNEVVKQVKNNLEDNYSVTRCFCELIQNIDDCEFTENDGHAIVSIEFDYEKKCIKLHYNEKGFEYEDVRGICSYGGSTKNGVDENGNVELRKMKEIPKGCYSLYKTGEKGVGFKAIYKIAKKVEIKSNGFYFALSADTPMMPEWLDVSPEDQREGTSITVYLKDEMDIKELEKNLKKEYFCLNEDNSIGNVLVNNNILFTRNIREITLKNEEKEYIFAIENENISPVDEDWNYSDEDLLDGEGIFFNGKKISSATYEFEFCVYEKENDIKREKQRIKLIKYVKTVKVSAQLCKKRYKAAKEAQTRNISFITVAEDSEKNCESGCFYTTLPLEEKIEMPFSVDAPFWLNQERSKIDMPDNENKIFWNIEILNKVKDCFAEFLLALKTNEKKICQIIGYTKIGNNSKIDKENYREKLWEIKPDIQIFKTYQNDETYTSYSDACFLESYFYDMPEVDKMADLIAPGKVLASQVYCDCDKLQFQKVKDAWDKWNEYVENVENKEAIVNYLKEKANKFFKALPELKTDRSILCDKKIFLWEDEIRSEKDLPFSPDELLVVGDGERSTGCIYNVKELIPQWDFEKPNKLFITKAEMAEKLDESIKKYSEKSEDDIKNYYQAVLSGCRGWMIGAGDLEKIGFSEAYKFKIDEDKYAPFLLPLENQPDDEVWKCFRTKAKKKAKKKADKKADKEADKEEDKEEDKEKVSNYIVKKWIANPTADPNFVQQHLDGALQAILESNTNMKQQESKLEITCSIEEILQAIADYLKKFDEKARNEKKFECFQKINHFLKINVKNEGDKLYNKDDVNIPDNRSIKVIVEYCDEKKLSEDLKKTYIKVHFSDENKRHGFTYAIINDKVYCLLENLDESLRDYVKDAIKDQEELGARLAFYSRLGKLNEYIDKNPDDKKKEFIEFLKELREFQCESGFDVDNIADQIVHSSNTWLEILQNINDARNEIKNDPNDPIEVKINKKEGFIELCYKERGFSYKDVKGITDLGNTEKDDNGEVTFTGEKGIGFKSVFQWAKNVEIHSNGFHFSIGNKNDKKDKNDIIKTCTIPEWIDESPEIYSDKTIIKLYLKKEENSDNKIDKIIEEIKKEDSYMCLDNCQKVILKFDGNESPAEFDLDKLRKEHYCYSVSLYEMIENENSRRVWMKKRKKWKCREGEKEDEYEKRLDEIAKKIEVQYYFVKKEESKEDWRDKTKKIKYYATLPLPIDDDEDINSIIINAPFDMDIARNIRIPSPYNKDLDEFIKENFAEAIRNAYKVENGNKIKFSDLEGEILFYFKNCTYADGTSIRKSIQELKLFTCWVKQDERWIKDKMALNDVLYIGCPEIYDLIEKLESESFKASIPRKAEVKSEELLPKLLDGIIAMAGKPGAILVKTKNIYHYTIEEIELDRKDNEAISISCIEKWFENVLQDSYELPETEDDSDSFVKFFKNLWKSIFESLPEGEGKKNCPIYPYIIEEGKRMFSKIADVDWYYHLDNNVVNSAGYYRIIDLLWIDKNCLKGSETEEEIKIKKRVRDYLYGAGMTEIIKEFGKKVIIEHLKKKLDSVEAYSDYFWGILREIYDLQKEG